jgi:hypothetical protein
LNGIKLFGMAEGNNHDKELEREVEREHKARLERYA